MKKLMLALTMVVLSVAITRADRETFDPTKTQLALPLPTAPTIDGVINLEEWKLGGGSATTAGGAHRRDFWRVRPNTLSADGIQGGALGDLGTVPADANDLSYDVVAGFDAQNLYIAVRVRDSVLTSDSALADSANGTTWMDDSVEIFIDGDNSNFAFRDTTGTNPDVVGSGGQFVIAANNAYRDAEAGSPGFGAASAWFAKVTPRTENDVVVGYDAEFRISLAAIGNPKPGDIIGFTVGVNDDDDGGSGDRQVMWVGTPHTESSYGNLLLQGLSYTAPKVATAPTVDGVIHAGEYAGAKEIKVDPTSGIWELGNNLDDNWPREDLSYSAWVVHTADAVYVAVDVVDDNVVADSAEAGSENGSTWEDDSIDIYFDADRSRDFGRGTTVGEGQYVFTAAGAHRHAEANNPTFGESAGWFAARSIKGTTRGYQIEFKVTKPMLMNPADGKVMGFFIDANDDDGGNRKSQLGWSGASHSEFTYGTLTLGGPITGTIEPPGRETFDPTKTQLALPLPTAPTIDGVINLEEWKLGGGSATTAGGAHRRDFWRVRPNTLSADGIQGGALGDLGTVPTDANDLSYDVVAGFDAQNLYIAVRVRDSVLTSDSALADSANGTTWMDDSVEIFIDGDNSNFAFRDTTGTNPDVVGSGGQFVIAANNAYRDAEAGSPGFGAASAWFAKVTPRTENDVVVGYDAEFRISLAAIGNPKPGDIIGFTVGVNDDDDGGSGDRQVMWVGTPHTESSYGNLLLQGLSYTAPKVATAPTVDGVIHAGEYAGAKEIKVDPTSGIWELGNNLDDNWPREDLSYSAWVVHTADAVYVAVDVVDDNVVADSAEAGSENGSTWEDDSIDIYFDADRSRDFGRGTTVGEGQYVFTAAGAHRHAEANNPTFGESAGWFAARTIKSTTRGYQIEFKVTKPMLMNPADGKVMGFFIDANDDDGGNRKSQLGWSGASHSEFTYGTLTLSAGGTAEFRIESISRVGNELLLTIQSPNATGTHKVLKSPTVGPATWAEVTGATFSVDGQGRLIARFPTPSATEFYRISMP